MRDERKRETPVMKEQEPNRRSGGMLIVQVAFLAGLAVLTAALCGALGCYAFDTASGIVGAVFLPGQFLP